MLVTKRNILIFEPYIFNMYGNLKYIGFIFDLLDRERFSPLLVVPFESDYLNVITEKGGKCLVVKTPELLLGYGGSTLKKGAIGKLLTALAVIKYTFSLVSVIKKESVDVVQCHSIRSLITIGFAAKLARKPVLWYIKGQLDNGILDRVGLLLADRVLYLTDALKRERYPWLNSVFRSKIGELRLGVELDKIRAIESSDKDELVAELDIDRERINFAFIGVISESKGVGYLVNAMIEVCKRASNIRLYLVGDHCIEANLEFNKQLDSLISKEGLEEQIIFTGWRGDAVAILSLMDFMVLPSLNEGFGRCIVEGMAMGVPAIGTKVGGIVDAISEEKTGILVEPRDTNALANAIILLVEDQRLREQLGEQARSVAYENYYIEKNVSGLEAAYETLLNKKGADLPI